MLDIRRRLLQIAGTIVAFPFAFVAIYYGITKYQDWHYVHPFEQVKRGDSQERVEGLLGSPHHVVIEVNHKVPWESKNTVIWYDAESVKEFRYIPFSITGEEYRVGFDTSGCVVSKFHITSP